MMGRTSADTAKQTFKRARESEIGLKKINAERDDEE